MPVVPLYNQQRQEVGTFELSPSVFAAEVKEHLFYEVVRAYQAAARAGTHSTKGRSLVAGSGRKIYKQKGTGNARHGDRKANIFVGGGIVFGPLPREHKFKVNKKVRTAALISALSLRKSQDALFVIDSLSLDAIKTKTAAAIANNFGKKVLIVDVDNDNLALSTRNLPNAKFLPVSAVNVYDILKYDAIVISQAAATALSERIG